MIDERNPDVLESLALLGKLCDERSTFGRLVDVKVKSLGLAIIVKQLSPKGIPYTYSYIIDWVKLKQCLSFYDYVEYTINDCIKRLEAEIERTNASSK